MALLNCFGKDVATGSPVEVAFRDFVRTVTPASAPADLYLAPGWIDLQVNGFAAVDFNHPCAPHEDIARSIRALFSTGVTRFYPTVITGSPGDMEGALRNLARAAESLAEGQAIDGFHVEGPHISPEDGPRGAHPRRWVRPPDFDEFRRWQDAARHRVRMVTLSPEWPAAPRYIERIAAQGVVAAIGHTQATSAQIAGAVSAGATLSTHLGNGAHATLRRHPNYIWDQLAEDRLMAGFIVDGIHLDASFLKVALRAKGIERSVLVTDATAPAGAAPGRYQLGEQLVDLTPDHRVVLAGQDRLVPFQLSQAKEPATLPLRRRASRGRGVWANQVGAALAGSALRMDRGIENLMKLAGLSLGDAVRMATTNAARAGKVPARQNGLAPGDRADFVQFRLDPATNGIQVVSTWVSGNQVYRA